MLLAKKLPETTLITMSVGMSMQAWDNAGIIHRELAYYKALSNYIGPLSFLTYGTHLPTEKRLLKSYIPDAKIIGTTYPYFSRLSGGFFVASFIPPLFIHKFNSIKNVRSNQISGSWAGAAIARQLKVPFILRCGYILSKNIQLEPNASILKKKITWLLERSVARRANAIIVTYSRAKEYLSEKHGICPKKIVIIGNPIDTERFAPADITTEKKRDILFVGRMMPEKNVGSILSACAKANASITLLGKGALKAELIQKADSLNLNAQFIDYMPNTQIPKLMHEHRIFIIASHYEGNPKALLEAMSCGMPCVASNIPEHKDLIEHKKDGILADSTDDKLCTAIRSIISNESLGKELGKNARKKILSDYSLESNAQKEYQLHQKVNLNFKSNLSYPEHFFNSGNSL
ncbi:group 1 glycosyl transferase [Candidatus Magnetomorum sp. HK-1]|nr:group 1 glycosyl transferase [Candidatus Magnetomorum sp. HK-1]